MRSIRDTNTHTHEQKVEMQKKKQKTQKNGSCFAKFGAKNAFFKLRRTHIDTRVLSAYIKLLVLF